MLPVSVGLSKTWVKPMSRPDQTEKVGHITPSTDFNSLSNLKDHTFSLTWCFLFLSRQRWSIKIQLILVMMSVYSYSDSTSSPPWLLCSIPVNFVVTTPEAPPLSWTIMLHANHAASHKKLEPFEEPESKCSSRVTNLWSEKFWLRCDTSQRVRNFGGGACCA